jgi:tetratricopeptide (TPR) repeat protein
MKRCFYPTVLCAAFAASMGASLFAQVTPGQEKIKPTPQGTRRIVNNPLNDLLDQARAAIERNDFQAAIEPLRKFLAEKDDFPYAHFQLGYVYTALKQPKEARADIQIGKDRKSVV